MSLFLYPALLPAVSKFLRKRHALNYKKIFTDHFEDNSYLISPEDRVKNRI
jgi:hypothetical protein